MSLAILAESNKLYFRLKKSILVFLTFFVSVTCYSQLPTLSSFSPTSAPLNGHVRIIGTNLSQVTAVSFGGVPAAFFFIASSTAIDAYVGSGASGSIVVTNAAGSASLAGFTYLSPPQIDFFSPTSAGYGDTVTIYGHRFSGTAQVNFGALSALSYTILSDTVIKAVVANGTSGSISLYVPTLGTAYIGGFTHTGPVINYMSPTAGPAGTVVTLYGKNFLNASSVKVGNIPATSFTVISNDTLSLVTPQNAADTITVTTPRGTGMINSFNKASIRYTSIYTGTAGDTIVIRGINMINPSAVTFGNTPAAWFIASGDTMIKALVDTLPTFGSVYITVTTPSYGTATSPNTFYYYEPLPSVYSFYPTMGGPGTIITIKGKRFTNTTRVAFSNTPAASFTIVSDSLILAVVGNGSSGYLSVENSLGSGSNGIFTFTTLPYISSFSPASGAPGTVLTIKGVNFSTGNSKVLFGPVKAPVLSATDTLIKVTVPFGAGTDPFIVTNDSLVTYAPKAFNVTFPGDSFFTASSFSIGANFQVTIPVKAIGDIDGDGKPDLVGTGEGNTFDSSKIYLYRNTSITGAIAFDTTLATISIKGTPKHIKIADVDGDGKQDIVIGYRASAAILKNTSTPGNISFAAAYHAPQTGGSDFSDMAISDLNQDGKPDIAFSSEDPNAVFIYRNNTVNGQIAFSNVSNFSNQIFYLPISVPVKIIAADIDGDKKNDLIVSSTYYNTSNGSAQGLVVMTNTSTNNGGFAFNTNNLYYGTAATDEIKLGDIDGDNKPDLVVTGTIGPQLISIFKNTSAGAPSFTLIDTFRVGRGPINVSITDVNGDKKKDIAVLNGTDTGVYTVYCLSLLKNKTTAGGSANFDTAVYVPLSNERLMMDVLMNDLDMDGKPDAIANTYFNFDTMVVILRNKVGPNLLQLCPPASSGNIPSSITGSSWQWQANTGNGFTAIANNSLYSGTNTATLQLNNIPSTMYGTTFRCLVDGTKFTDPVEIRFRNTWTGNVSTAWENAANWSCGTVPDNNTDVVINSGTVSISSNIVVGSLTVSDNAAVNIAPSFTIVLTR